MYTKAQATAIRSRGVRRRLGFAATELFIDETLVVERELENVSRQLKARDRARYRERERERGRFQLLRSSIYLFIPPDKPTPFPVSHTHPFESRSVTFSYNGKKRDAWWNEEKFDVFSLFQTISWILHDCSTLRGNSAFLTPTIIFGLFGTKRDNRRKCWRGY